MKPSNCQDDSGSQSLNRICFISAARGASFIVNITTYFGTVFVFHTALISTFPVVLWLLLLARLVVGNLLCSRLFSEKRRNWMEEFMWRYIYTSYQLSSEFVWKVTDWRVSSAQAVGQKQGSYIDCLEYVLQESKIDQDFSSYCKCFFPF